MVMMSYKDGDGEHGMRHYGWNKASSLFFIPRMIKIISKDNVEKFLQELAIMLILLTMHSINEQQKVLGYEYVQLCVL